MQLSLKATAFGGLLAIAIFTHGAAAAQQKDSTRKPILLKTNGLKPYREIITANAASWHSFVSVHKADNRYLLEIPDALMGRELMTVNRITRGPADFRSKDLFYGYAGDMAGYYMFHFEKGEGNRVFIRVKTYKERAGDSSANGLAKSLLRNNAEPLVQSFAVKTTNDSLHTTVIDITDYLAQDNPLFSFDPAVKTAAGLGPVAADRSFIDSVEASAQQVTFSFVRTYNKPVSKGSATMAPVTFELSSMLICLPEVPMPARTSDRRTGFQEITYIDFDKNPLGVANKGNILRWRITASQPVTFYIDSLFPAKWVPAVKAGILAWNGAFEKAGFKEAIRVVVGGAAVPGVQVVFKPGAAGQQDALIADPRSGEIIAAQLSFYLGTLDELYKRYLVQAGALDKAARRPSLDDATMSLLVQAWVTQQTGRLLGLRPNAGASWGNRLSDVRNNQWLSANAFNGSAMDEALINYVVQPEDKVAPASLLAKVSAADGLLISWGYSEPAPAVATVVGKVVMPDEQTDARSQLGDVGNDAVKAASLGIGNLRSVAPHLLEWTRQPGVGYQKAAGLYNTLVEQYRKYLRYVENQLGGIYIDAKNSDQPGARFSFVPPATQQAALQFLSKEVLQTPLWLNDTALYAQADISFDMVTTVQKDVLNGLLDLTVLAKLLVVRDNNPTAYWEPSAYLQALSAAVFSELGTHSEITVHRRELQKVYINKLISMQAPAGRMDNDIPALLRQHIKSLLGRLKQVYPTYTGLSRTHLQDLYERLYTGFYAPASSSDKSTRVIR